MVKSLLLSTAMTGELMAFQEILLSALGEVTLPTLARLLNSIKMLRSKEGCQDDCGGFEYTEHEENLAANVMQHLCNNNPSTALFHYMAQFLDIIDRWDAYADIIKILGEHTKPQLAKLQQSIQDKKTYNRNAQNNPVKPDETINQNPSKFNRDFCSGNESNILTISDLERVRNKKPLQLYDAFILYADEDLNYALEILDQLEGNPHYNLKFCIKDRDLLDAVPLQHVALTKLIGERCKHLIVILTAEFLKSPENRFLVDYTQALQIRYKMRKIVPLVYEEGIDIPRTLKIYTHLRYNSRTTILFNFWSKLAHSIQSVSLPPGDQKTIQTPTCRNNKDHPSLQYTSVECKDMSRFNTVTPKEKESYKNGDIAILNSPAIKSQERADDTSNFSLCRAYTTGISPTSLCWKNTNHSDLSITHKKTTSFTKFLNLFSCCKRKKIKK